MALAASTAVTDAAQQLAGVSDSPRLDAELLMAHALGMPREQMLLTMRDHACPEGFAPLLARRLAHEPVAYILGERDFWSIRLHVGPGVLIPRPDSEVLIEAALEHFAGHAAPRHILDLGTGPGTLLLAALSEWPEAQGVGIDASPIALDYAQRNAAALGFAERVHWRSGDWAQGVKGRFDLILSNPPYVESGAVLDPQVAAHEPAKALFAGVDGLDVYRRLLPQLPARLERDGVAIVEIGATQRDAVSALARAAGFTVTGKADLGGWDRALLLTIA